MLVPINRYIELKPQLARNNFLLLKSKGEMIIFSKKMQVQYVSILFFTGHKVTYFTANDPLFFVLFE